MELYETKCVKDEKIRKLHELVECNKENFEKDKKRLNFIHKKENIIHEMILERYAEEYEKTQKYMR